MAKKRKEQAQGEMHMTPAAVSAALEGDIKNALIASTPGGIERQEAEGQADMVRGCRLPKRLNRYKTDKLTAEQAYERMGIKVTGEYDDIFLNVELPDGWKLEPTEHDMWSHLKDSKGRARANVFYKAAFYDRSAHIDINSRFRCAVEPEDRYKSGVSAQERGKIPWQGVVYDSDKEIFATKPRMLKGGYEKREKAEEKMLNECKKFLEKNYPEWGSEFAYWD